MSANEISDLIAPYLERKSVARLANPAAASGLCKDEAFKLASWLEERGIAAVVLNLSNPRGFDFERVQPFWQAGYLQFAIHYVVRVGAVAIDLTARQFDPDLPFPLLSDLAELRERWASAYDLSLPLSASQLWLD